ncbi:hypothetical protein GGR56DRAFT_116020 [Xylariaceae sp. FL0804]|nr:hypothetical protein GGR56DRAFT_116020 [Xylariaceae sp. FL0804]
MLDNKLPPAQQQRSPLPPNSQYQSSFHCATASDRYFLPIYLILSVLADNSLLPLCLYAISIRYLPYRTCSLPALCLEPLGSCLPRRPRGGSLAKSCVCARVCWGSVAPVIAYLRQDERARPVGTPSLLSSFVLSCTFPDYVPTFDGEKVIPTNARDCGRAGTE